MADVAPDGEIDVLMAPRWRGQPGRTEVWYLTASDAATGSGLWVHHETVAPAGGATPYAHGWAALFRPGSAPLLERFGPATVAGSAVGSCTLTASSARGSAGSLRWDLELGPGGPPLFTFPRTVWERELLPGAQVVPVPNAPLHGEVQVGGQRIELAGHGAVARIFGHGSAERWGWLHAALDGGGTLEIVTATARRRWLRRIRPLALVGLRQPDEPDWPVNSVLAAPRLRTKLRPDGFSVRGRHRGRTIEIDVDIPPNDAVALTYTDPDGATATCTNSERATATISFRGRRSARRWQLDATAHAEVGTRP